MTHLLFTNRGEYVPLPGPTLLEFRFRMHYELIKDERPGFGPFRATTKSYDYSLRKAGGASVLDYHWHPSGRSHEMRPHVHLGSAQLRPDAVLSNKVHLLSGRATLESVLRTAIDLGARPLRDDRSDRLTERSRSRGRRRGRWPVRPTGRIRDEAGTLRPSSTRSRRRRCPAGCRASGVQPDCPGWTDCGAAADRVRWVAMVRAQSIDSVCVVSTSKS